MAGNLVPIGGGKPTRPSLLPRLKARVEAVADEPYGTAISAADDVISAAREALPAFRVVVAPARREDRIAVLVTLANMVGKPDVLRNGGHAEQRMFWDKYHELLHHIPIDVLSRACDAYVLSPPPPGGKWFPDPGTLLHHARQDDRWATDLRVVKGLDKLAKARSEEPYREFTEAEKADISARLGALRARFAKADAAAMQERDASNRAALDWYRSPRDWSKRPGRATA